VVWVVFRVFSLRIYQLRSDRAVGSGGFYLTLVIIACPLYVVGVLSELVMSVSLTAMLIKLQVNSKTVLK
jgi:hypothetical protein